ncbi:MAG: TlpA family protein disulfide reductase [Clostridiales bacterium]|nr:TlpA family protein disulfide reductase [Clostridiales bacterium]
MKKNKKTVFIWIIVIVIVILAAYAAYTLLSKGYMPDIPEDTTQEEKPIAPDFTVYDWEGNEVHLKDFFGKPIVLNFWASWCGPCRSEMPDFDEVYSEYGDRVEFLMINLVDGRRETLQSGKEYAESQGFSFPVYFDMDLEASLSYGITSYPTTIFIDDEGHFLKGYIGAINKQILLDSIDQLLD